MDIERLREAGKCTAGCHPHVCACALCDEAADEIEQLRTALAPLAALKLWRDTYPDAGRDTLVDGDLAYYFAPDEVRRARELIADMEDK
jgi:hypothetical protein